MKSDDNAECKYTLPMQLPGVLPARAQQERRQLGPAQLHLQARRQVRHHLQEQEEVPALPLRQVHRDRHEPQPRPHRRPEEGQVQEDVREEGQRRRRRGERRAKAAPGDADLLLDCGQG